jgi:hypothetical protein
VHGMRQLPKSNATSSCLGGKSHHVTDLADIIPAYTATRSIAWDFPLWLVGIQTIEVAYLRKNSPFSRQWRYSEILLRQNLELRNGRILI